MIAGAGARIPCDGDFAARERGSFDFAQGRLFDFVTASHPRSSYCAQNDRGVVGRLDGSSLQTKSRFLCACGVSE
jgi:hypothetical protein